MDCQEQTTSEQPRRAKHCNQLHQEQSIDCKDKCTQIHACSKQPHRQLSMAKYLKTKQHKKFTAFAINMRKYLFSHKKKDIPRSCFFPRQTLPHNTTFFFFIEQGKFQRSNKLLIAHQMTVDHYHYRPFKQQLPHPPK